MSVLRTMETAARTLPAITSQVVTTAAVTLDSAETDLPVQVSSQETRLSSGFSAHP